MIITKEYLQKYIEQTHMFPVLFKKMKNDCIILYKIQLVIIDNGVIVKKYNSVSKLVHIVEPIFDSASQEMSYVQAFDEAKSFYFSKFDYYDGIAGILHVL